jgi:hypothetical protein
MGLLVVWGYGKSVGGYGWCVGEGVLVGLDGVRLARWCRRGRLVMLWQQPVDRGRGVGWGLRTVWCGGEGVLVGLGCNRLAGVVAGVSDAVTACGHSMRGLFHKTGLKGNKPRAEPA